MEALAPLFRRACDSLMEASRIVKGARVEEEEGMFAADAGADAAAAVLAAGGSTSDAAKAAGAAAGIPTASNGAGSTPATAAEEQATKAAQSIVRDRIASITCYCRLFRNLCAGCSDNQSSVASHGILSQV